MSAALVSGYPHRMAGHCGSGALRDLLEWAGLTYGQAPLGEGFAFGVGGVIGFSYLRAPGLGTPFYLVGRGSALTEQFSARLGVGCERHATDDPVEGWEGVRAELDEGRPVLCWAEMAELPYLRVSMRMTRHDIVLTGHDDRADTVTVVDNDRADPQTVSRADLARARSAQGFPAPTRHTWYRLRFPERLPDVRVVAASACADAARELASPSALPGMPGGAATGIAGVERFVGDLDRWSGDFDEAGLDRALFTLWVFVEKAGTGGGLFRRLQAEFLADLAELLPEPAVAEARDAWALLARAWTDLADHAKAKGPVAARLGEVRRHAQALPDLEARAAASLGAVADALAP
ncbi:BtrH N-terminal domain-containing protein [Pseudonocardia sp. WMMC193]|uniref:BtrH N-terminal domain-containing protein n=1 Tax=Pseudonocardia sp. WMMC193 TaxID=2911965 RepID=UPI001F1A4A85|nr:BtrH N-terminal domain-containing protein [Pseudonocardia sp. WMMC193]MCF7550763.1 BtrH N-terminal domain-containing protein [Pseudonocardia sp. WMMC193]